jgi:transcriptional regulator with XRE-family HTH domain
MYLDKALSLWAEHGFTRRDFSRLTGIDASTVSRLFSGKRGLNMEQRRAIFLAFREKDLHQGLLLLRADLEENITEECREFIKVILNEPSMLSEDTVQKETQTQRAKRKFIAELEADEPGALELVRALYEWEDGA